MNVALNIELSDPLVRVALLVLKQAAMDVVDGYVHRHSAGEHSALGFLVAANLAHRAHALAELHPSAITSHKAMQPPSAFRSRPVPKPRPADLVQPYGVSWQSASGRWRVQVRHAGGYRNVSFPGTAAGLADAIKAREAEMARRRAT